MYEVTVKEWFEGFEDNDFSYLVKNKVLKKVFKWCNTFPKGFNKAFDDINNHNYKIFGINDEYREILEIKIKLSKLYLKRVKSKDKFIDNDIAILEIDLQNLEGKSNKNPSLYELLNEIEAVLETSASPFMSVYDFKRKREAVNEKINAMNKLAA